MADRGLVSFDDFLDYADDEAVSRRGKRPVRPLMLKVDGKAEGFYLKQFRLTPRFLFTETRQQSIDSRGYGALLAHQIAENRASINPQITTLLA